MSELGEPVEFLVGSGTCPNCSYTPVSVILLVFAVVWAGWAFMPNVGPRYPRRTKLLVAAGSLAAAALIYAFRRHL